MTAIKPDLTPSRQLFAAGFKLCRLHENSKRPIGNAWNKAEHCVTEFDESAHGYGMPLAINGLCSIDPDDATRAAIGMDATGFDLKTLLESGCRTLSTRPGSGGRSTFKDPGGLKWISFVGRINGKNVTILELRAESPNLQDVIPGLHYLTKDGTDCTQQYANGRTFLDAPDLDPALLRWWRRMSEDHAYQIEQQTKFLAACGVDPVLPHCTGGALPFPIKGTLRALFNEMHPVEAILADHDYAESQSGRWSPASATGAPGVRPIPQKLRQLWQSDHQSDPLRGTFDAWAANVILNFGGSAEAALDAFRAGEFALEVELADPPAEQVFQPVAAAEVIGAGEVTNGPEETPPPHVWTATPTKARLGLKPEDVRFVVDHWLQERKVGLIASEGGAGKTTLLIHLLVCVVTGREFFGHTIKRKGPAMLLSRDDDQDDLDAVLQEIVLAMDLTDEEIETLRRDLYLISLADDGAYMLVQPRDKGWGPSPFVPLLQAEVARIKPVLVAVDTIRQFTGIESTDEAAQIVFMSMCKSLTRASTSVIAAHHVGKQAARERIEDMYSAIGSSALADNARFVWRLMREDDPTALHLPKDTIVPIRGGFLRLTSTRGSLRVMTPDDLVYSREGYRLALVEGARKKGKSERAAEADADLRRRVLDFFQSRASGASAREAEGAVTGTAKSIRGAVKELAASGLLLGVGRRGGGTLYRVV